MPLMNLPWEIREHIFKYAQASNEKHEVGICVCYDTKPIRSKRCKTLLAADEWQKLPRAHEPLLSLSRQVRREYLTIREPQRYLVLNFCNTATIVMFYERRPFELREVIADVKVHQSFKKGYLAQVLPHMRSGFEHEFNKMFTDTVLVDWQLIRGMNCSTLCGHFEMGGAKVRGWDRSRRFAEM